MKLREQVKLMQVLRVEQGKTRAALARECCMQPTIITWAENGRFIPYDSQLEKIAAALGWKGDLQELLQEVREQ